MTLNNWVISTKGYSTLHIPIHLRRIKLEINPQYNTLEMGLKPNLLKLLNLRRANRYKIKIDDTSPITPPSLLVIERRIA